MVVALWFVFAVAVGIIAGSRGRSGFGWFVLAALFTPLLMVILVLALPSLKVTPDSEAPSPLTHVRCPDCKELVLAEAVKCKHCGTALTPTDLSGAVAEHARQQRADDQSAMASKIVAIGLLVALAIGVLGLLGGR